MNQKLLELRNLLKETHPDLLIVFVFAPEGVVAATTESSTESYSQIAVAFNPETFYVLDHRFDFSSTPGVLYFNYTTLEEVIPFMQRTLIRYNGQTIVWIPERFSE